ncbi:hypothetical protein OXYTRIMIC_777 [Oxytricha trifallax]|uniref:Uncharacterized protein n=1 Tax=Oxytricha trifallax TaxID=1172189 RepID=A0A073HYA1_9SPIT|nr:hypothetical protein OXYTRIMIC_777 [Oxytricha trifallax]
MNYRLIHLYEVDYSYGVENSATIIHELKQINKRIQHVSVQQNTDTQKTYLEIECYPLTVGLHRSHFKQATSKGTKVLGKLGIKIKTIVEKSIEEILQQTPNVILIAGDIKNFTRAIIYLQVQSINNKYIYLSNFKAINSQYTTLPQQTGAKCAKCAKCFKFQFNQIIYQIQSFINNINQLNLQNCFLLFLSPNLLPNVPNPPNPLQYMGDLMISSAKCVKCLFSANHSNTNRQYQQLGHLYTQRPVH